MSLIHFSNHEDVDENNENDYFIEIGSMPRRRLFSTRKHNYINTRNNSYMFVVKQDEVVLFVL